MESTSNNNNNNDDIKLHTNTKVRNVLTLSERLKLINDIEMNGLSRKDVAQKYNIAKSAVYQTVKRKSFWKDQLLRTHNDTIKRVQKLKYEKIDMAMNIFIRQTRSRSNKPISGALLKKKALCYADHFGYSDFRASDGWLSKLKIRHNLKHKGYNEELSDVDETDTMHIQPLLKECALIKCNSRETFDENNEIEFFRFPMNPRQMGKWITALKDKPLRTKSKEVLHLCSKHFQLNADNQITKNAIPTVFDDINDDENITDNNITDDNNKKLKTKRKKRVKCKNEKYNLQRICRSCLKNPLPDEKMIPVFGGTNIIGSNLEAISIYEELKQLNLKVAQDDGLPQQICNGCMDFLKMLNTFRTLCERTQSALEQYVHNRPPQRLVETIWIENKMEENKSSWPLKKRKYIGKIDSTSDCNFDNYSSGETVPYDICVKDNRICENVADVENNGKFDENDPKTKINELINSENINEIDGDDNDMEEGGITSKPPNTINDDMNIINHKNNKWPCKFCGNHFVNRDRGGITSYQKPSEKCTLNKELKCLYCDQIFYNDIEKYVKHINTFHPYGLVCWICNESSSDRNELANHIASHSVSEFTAGI